MKHTECIGCDPTELKNRWNYLRWQSKNDNKNNSSTITTAQIAVAAAAAAAVPIGRKSLLYIYFVVFYYLFIYCFCFYSSSSFLFGLLPVNSMRPKSKYNHRFLHWIYYIVNRCRLYVTVCRLPFVHMRSERTRKEGWRTTKTP